MKNDLIKLCEGYISILKRKSFQGDWMTEKTYRDWIIEKVKKMYENKRRKNEKV